MKLSSVLEQVRRQQRRETRLREEQRLSALRGDIRHSELDVRLAQIEANTARIDELTARVDEIESDLDKHWADDKRHTGKAD